MTARDDMMIEVGNQLGQLANLSAREWDYCAFVFETADGLATSMQTYLYKGEDRLTMSKGPKFMELRRAILRLRDVTEGADDRLWIKCLAGIHKADRNFQVKFEFDNPQRWAIHPGNAAQARPLVLGDLFPEVI